ncbi:hypothetical protein K488DRAFT_26092, partial [Vararia minispora EC-137]
SPLVLDTVSSSELDALLSILYPSDPQARDFVADWIVVLRLATRWSLPSFRATALDALDDALSPLDKLVLARELDISEWLLPSFIALCTQKEFLTLAEAERLSLPDV